MEELKFPELWERIKGANDQIHPMTFERYDKKKGKTIKKDYAEVNQRVKAFRMVYPGGVIETELLEDDGKRVLIRAYVYATRDDSRPLADGIAEEMRGSSDVNRTSAIENCQTSAIGRALGFAGFGIDTSIASFEEVASATMKQEAEALATIEEKEGLMSLIEEIAAAKGYDKGNYLEDVLKLVGFNRNKQPEGMTARQYGEAMNYLIKEGK